MKKDKLIPKRRFKEFENDEAWEQRKLGEVSESYSGGTPSVGNKSYYGGSIPFIRSAEINSESTELFLTEEGLTNSSARMVSKGDILYALYGATSGETGRSRINGAINQAILAILPHDGYDSEFLMQWLRKSKQNITDIYLQGGQGNLSGAIVKALEVNFPSLAEQRQIGNYFQSIDKLITLHQRRLKKLKELKLAYLSEMFPEEGEKYPKRRFAGFTEPWEQRKVKDIFKVTRGHVLAATKTAREKTDSTPYPVYSSQTADQGLMGYYNDYLYSDAITWTTDGANAGTVNYREGKFYCTNVCGVLISEEGYANKMVSEALNKVAWKHVSKVGNPKLMNNVMSEIVISIPKNMKEQKEISCFFSNLDHLITLHQRKLEKLENMKKAYLNEMFV